MVDIAADGDTVTRLHVLFEQHCEGGEPALFGEIRYQVPGGDSDLLLAPSRVQWPVTYPGEPARPVPVTVENTGASSLAVGTPVITGEDSGEFAVASSTCSSSLPPGDSCTAHVRFAPAAPGPASATAVVP